MDIARVAHGEPEDAGTGGHRVDPAAFLELSRLEKDRDPHASPDPELGSSRAPGLLELGKLFEEDAIRLFQRPERGRRPHPHFSLLARLHRQDGRKEDDVPRRCQPHSPLRVLIPGENVRLKPQRPVALVLQRQESGRNLPGEQDLDRRDLEGAGETDAGPRNCERGEKKRRQEGNEKPFQAALSCSASRTNPSPSLEVNRCDHGVGVGAGRGRLIDRDPAVDRGGHGVQVDRRGGRRRRTVGTAPDVRVARLLIKLVAQEVGRAVDHASDRNGRRRTGAGVQAPLQAVDTPEFTPRRARKLAMKEPFHSPFVW